MFKHARPRLVRFLPATLLALALLPACALAASVPSITAGSAANITISTATMRATVNPDNSWTKYYFQYGMSTSYGSTTATLSLSSGTTAIAVPSTVAGLTSGATYHYRLVATNTLGTSYGADASFATPAVTPTAPVASTAAASGVSASAATLNGTVKANGAATSFHFDYGTSSAYGQSTTSASAGSGTSAVAELAALTGLQTSTTYHFRVVAANSVGTANGQDMTLTTAASGATSTSYDQAVLADSPVAYWGMRTPTSAESDLTGNGHIGTYKGGTPTLATLPNGDKAADFNGSSQYMTVPSSSAFSIPTTGEMTWEGWIRPDTLQWSSSSDPYGYGYADWMGKCENYGPTCEWESRMYSTNNPEGRCNRVSAYVFNPGAGLGAAADWQPNCNLLGAGQWLHVVGEYQTKTTPSGCNAAYPGSINVWVNGVPWNQSYHMPTGCMSQYGIKPTAATSPLDIGTMAMDSWFMGAIGKVAVYNKLLSQPQINAHFAAMTGAQPSGSCQSSCTF